MALRRRCRRSRSPRAAAAGRRAGQQVGRDGDVASLGQLIGHAADPIGQAEDLVDHDHGGGFVLHLGIGDEAIHLALAVFDFHPFEVARGFFEACLGPIGILLGEGRN